MFFMDFPNQNIPRFPQSHPDVGLRHPPYWARPWEWESSPRNGAAVDCRVVKPGGLTPKAMMNHHGLPMIFMGIPWEDHGKIEVNQP